MMFAGILHQYEIYTTCTEAWFQFLHDQVEK